MFKEWSIIFIISFFRWMRFVWCFSWRSWFWILFENFFVCFAWLCWIVWCFLLLYSVCYLVLFKWFYRVFRLRFVYHVSFMIDGKWSLVCNNSLLLDSSEWSNMLNNHFLFCIFYRKTLIIKRIYISLTSLCNDKIMKISSRLRDPWHNSYLKDCCSV